MVSLFNCSLVSINYVLCQMLHLVKFILVMGFCYLFLGNTNCHIPTCAREEFVKLQIRIYYPELWRSLR
jgi:hypothetical protein